jgi:hypothetical protein
MQIWLSIIINALLLLVVCVQAYIYHRQWQIMQQQLALQSKQIEQAKLLQEMSDRPWVIDTSITVKGGLVEKSAEQQTVFTVTFTNAGRIPANNTKAKVWVAFTKKTAIKDFERPAIPFQSQGVVVPGKEMHAPITTEKPIEEGRLNQIASGDLSVYVHGILTYDIPSGEGKTEFCHIYRPRRGSFTAYKEGNYAK